MARYQNVLGLKWLGIEMSRDRNILLPPGCGSSVNGLDLRASLDSRDIMTCLVVDVNYRNIGNILSYEFCVSIKHCYEDKCLKIKNQIQSFLHKWSEHKPCQ